MSDSADRQEIRDGLAGALRENQRTADEQSNSIRFSRRIDQDEAVETLKSLGYVKDGRRRETPSAKLRGPTIKGLRRSKTVVGQGFNVQPDGESAIAVLGSGFEPGSTIHFNGVPMRTTYGTPELLSAHVPSETYAREALIEVTVRNSKSEVSNVRPFRVRASRTSGLIRLGIPQLNTPGRRSV